MRKTSGWHPGGLIVALFLAAAPTVEAQDAETDVLDIGTLSVVGSRLPGRSAHDSPVPVDVIAGDDLQTYGIRDMDSLLRATVPSYNVSQQPISDAATFVRPANLRGLPPDSTLVLVNGKRRHRAGVISLFGNGLADGAQGADISVIPAIALERVEVLRDGAAAQYGSDAIAGVLNFKLRENRAGLLVQTSLGQTYHGDGDKLNVAANLGVPLTEHGFANFSFEFMNADETSRSVQRGDALDLIAAGNAHVRRPATQIWGAPEVQYDYKFFGNLGLDLEELGARLYAFGNYAERKVEGGFYFRNPNDRDGIFDGPLVDRDGTVVRDANGNPVRSLDAARERGIDTTGLDDTIPVADLSGTGAGCPVVRTNPAADYADWTGGGLPAHCFLFNERFPGGFTPRFGGYVQDWSVAFGLRGKLEGRAGAAALLDGWAYDASASFGHNSVDIFMHGTINPQLAALRTNIPTSYRPGTDTQFDKTFNLDVSRPVDLGLLSSPLNAAFGFEYRVEEFEKAVGGENSWYIDDRYDLAGQGFNIGSNGFSGYGPAVAGAWERRNYALYLDLEAAVVESVLVGLAGRYENFDGDIGESVNGKASVQWQLLDALALRGSASSGFRAPTPGQINLQNTTTLSVDGRVQDQSTLPAYHPAATFFGAKPLTPEKSVNYSAGTVFTLGDLELTLDYYRIKVQDRIAFSKSFNKNALARADRERFDALVPGGSSIGAVRYYTNDFDTTTQGVDLVATYPLRTAAGTTKLTLVGNWNKTEVDSRDPDVIDDKRVTQIEETLPEFRFTLTADHTWGLWRFLTRLHFFDDFHDFHVNEEAFSINAGERWLLDVEVSRTLLNVPFMQAVTLSAGAENVFDQYPRRNPYARALGARYPESSPFGFSGGFYYLRAGFEF